MPISYIIFVYLTKSFIIIDIHINIDLLMGGIDNE